MSLLKSISSFNTSEIKKLFKTARTVQKIPGLTIKIAPKQLDQGRILVVTPRRSGKAVQRNAFRRRIKSLFFEERLFLLDYDWAIFAEKDVIDLPFTHLKKLFSTITQKLSSAQD